VTQTTGGALETLEVSTARSARAGLLLRYPEAWIGALSALFFAWRVGTPSAWWDESITRDIVSRPAEDIISLTRTVDLVHATYYLIVHALLGPDASLTAIRLLSVAAAAATGVLLVRIGRELDSLPVGITAGVLWTVAPLATRYAQEARPYAVTALAVTTATLLMLRICRRPWLPGRWVAYVASILVVGLLNVLALLILLVHLVHVASTASRAVRRRWYAAAGVSLVLLSPLLVGSATQRAQVSWLPRPDASDLLGFLNGQFAVGPGIVALVVLAAFGLGRGTHPTALGLGLTWALLPPALLWTVSQAHPLFDWRYVFFTVPGAALALASLAPLLRPRWTAVVVTAIAVAGFHMQLGYRSPTTGHHEDVRSTAQIIGKSARPGDAVVFLPASRRVVSLGYPDEFRNVDDVALALDPVSSATLWGVEAPPAELGAALRTRTRVWVVTGPRRYGEGSDPVEKEKARLLSSGFRLALVQETNRYEVRLYLREPRIVVPPEDLAGSPRP
jgi:mannosyltransferase